MPCGPLDPRAARPSTKDNAFSPSRALGADKYRPLCPVRWGGPMAKAKDPVCGMTVDTEKPAAKGVYGGQTVYFCSTSCRKQYETTHQPD